MSAAAVYSSFDRPFPNATGRGIKIAVIDSGVNASHPHIYVPVSGVSIGDGPIAKSSLNSAANVEIIPNPLSDELGHGTAVTAAIQEKAPGAQYRAVKLFHESLSSTSLRLMRAIEWAIDDQVNLINLSLGTPNMAYRDQFMALVDRATSAGVVLVCAKQEGERPVLPGMLEGVVSVDVDWRLPRNAYSIAGTDKARTYFASGFPRPLPGLSPIRNLSGISFAVANMTGLLARACEQTGARALPDIEQALLAEVSRLQE